MLVAADDDDVDDSVRDDVVDRDAPGDRRRARGGDEAALEAGRATVTDIDRSDDPGEAWEVEVLLDNGDEMDVELAADSLEVRARTSTRATDASGRTPAFPRIRRPEEAARPGGLFGIPTGQPWGHGKAKAHLRARAEPSEGPPCETLRLLSLAVAATTVVAPSAIDASLDRRTRPPRRRGGAFPVTIEHVYGETTITERAASARRDGRRGEPRGAARPRHRARQP